MKKILSLILCMVFALSLAACGEDSNNKSGHTVDIEYYASLGQISDLGYKLGDDVESTKNGLSSMLDDHGESNYFDFTSDEYTIMTDGSVYCCYKTEELKKGLTHIVKCGDAYGFTIGTISNQIRDTMSDMGYDAKERDAKKGELFFLPSSGALTVLEYEIEDNTLLFVFEEHSLSATVICK